jgi:hypothetical protein
MAIITFEPEFRPALPCVFGAKDYQEFRADLIEADRILSETGLEERLIAAQIASYETPFPPRQIKRHIKTLRLAFRHNILLAITGLSFRQLSLRLADSPLFQWFTHTGLIDGVRPVSKSTLERFEKLIDVERVSEMIHELNQAVADAARAEKLLYRQTALRFDAIFADTTCVKADIHFPVDWVLLRDATRTLVQAIILIREHGLKHRIAHPETFIRSMNKLCIEMTHTRKKKDAKKARKLIFRRMKQLMKTIEQHAGRYHALLEENRGQTDWSELEAQVVLDRMQNILDQLPKAISQAHERIIGERRVANSDKILSLYDPHIHVLVRGKAGAEVEFGNGLYLAEQADGLIIDWDFMKNQPRADNKLVEPSLERICGKYGLPESYTTDRGFDAAANDLVLENLSVFNGICPKSPIQLQEKLEDETFCLLQKRRGSTEGRIGIFKNAYLGNPMRSKCFEHRKLRITWSILGHNLWKLAVMAAQKKAELDAAEAAA